MKYPTWRDRCKNIIRKVLTEKSGQPEDVIKKALFDAYPFGVRERYPYKIWLDEIRVQRKMKKKPLEYVDPSQGRLLL